MPDDYEITQRKARDLTADEAADRVVADLVEDDGMPPGKLSERELRAQAAELDRILHT